MNATQQRHALGQSLWLDNITHTLLTSGTLDHYVRDLAVTGLTSNPTIFDHAIKDRKFYDDAIRRRSLAVDEDTLAADLQREGTAAFAKSWHELMLRSAAKRGVFMIDISPGMVERSRRKAPTYEGALDARVMDVQALGFPDAIFDTIARAATVYSESALLARGPLDWEGNVR